MYALGQRFQVYASQVTALPVAWGEPVDARLPQYLAHRYAAYHIRVDGWPMHAIVVKGDEPPPPAVLHKQVHQLLEIVGGQTAAFCLVAEHLPPYLRRRLIEMRMPFVIPGHQLFWPALGNAATTQRARRLQPKPVARLAPAAQQLLIAALLLRLPRPATVTGAAEALGYTPMSMSRALKELEGAGLARSTAHGRLRSFTLAFPPAETWTTALPTLRSPVIDTVRVMRRELPDAVSIVAGESALAERSELAAPAEPTFAVASRIWTRHHRSVELIPTMDEGTCRVELWRYAPETTAEHGVADPLSLFLSLQTNPDDRVQQALAVMMKRMPWRRAWTLLPRSSPDTKRNTY